ncbi:WD40-repeat-containing domain protein [Phlyctochytrium arcticum]|nr:WD40-repeat-containing domain protein [Phlyctochytrium arcticum]
MQRPLSTSRRTPDGPVVNTSRGGPRPRSSKTSAVFPEGPSPLSLVPPPRPIEVTSLASLSASFPKLPPQQRANILLALLNQCDPEDMKFLSSVLPRLHRDFVNLLPKPITHQMILYVHPRDLCTMVRISPVWNSVVGEDTLWKKLYAQIGLGPLSSRLHDPRASVKINAKRLYSLKQWTEGILKCRTVKAHEGSSVRALMSDGKHILTVGGDNSVRLHDLEGKQLLNIVGHDFTCAQFDDIHVVTGSASGVVHVWMMKTGNVQYELLAHEGPVTCLKFVARSLVTASADKHIKLWDMGSFGTRPSTTRGKPPLHQSSNKGLGSHAAAPAKISLLRTLVGHEAGIKCVDFSKHLLLSGDLHGCIRVWHFQSGNCLSVVRVGGSISVPNFCPQRKIPKKDAASVTSEQQQRSHDPVSCISYNGHFLLFSTFSGKLFLYKTTLPELLNGVAPNAEYPVIREWINGSDAFVLKSVYGMNTDGSVETSQGERSSPSSSQPLLAQDESSVTNRPGSARPAPTIPHQSVQSSSSSTIGQHNNWSLSASADKWRIIGGGSDGRCFVWNHLTQRRLFTLRSDQLELAGSLTAMKGATKGEGRAVTGIVITDKVVLIGSLDGTVRIWDCKYIN